MSGGLMAVQRKRASVFQSTRRKHKNAFASLSECRHHKQSSLSRMQYTGGNIKNILTSDR